MSKVKRYFYPVSHALLFVLLVIAQFFVIIVIQDVVYRDISLATSPLMANGGQIVMQQNGTVIGTTIIILIQ